MLSFFAFNFTSQGWLHPHSSCVIMSLDIKDCLVLYIHRAAPLCWKRATKPYGLRSARASQLLEIPSGVSTKDASSSDIMGRYTTETTAIGAKRQPAKNARERQGKNEQFKPTEF